MQKDLENLAKEMQKLESEDKRYWLYQIGHCREIAHPSTYPTYKTLNQIGADFRHFCAERVRRLLLHFLHHHARPFLSPDFQPGKQGDGSAGMEFQLRLPD